MICCFHWEWTREGALAPNSWIVPPRHGTTAPSSLHTALHSADREIPSTSHHPIKATGALTLRRAAAHSPAGKGFQGRQAQPLHFPRDKTGPEAGLRCLSPWTNKWRSQEPRDDSAGLGLCPAPVPLPGATSAATPRLPSCSSSLVPTSANSQLSRLPPTSWKGKMASAGSLPLHFPPLISSQLLLPPSLHPTTPIKGSTSPWG